MILILNENNKQGVKTNYSVSWNSFIIVLILIGNSSCDDTTESSCGDCSEIWKATWTTTSGKFNDIVIYYNLTLHILDEENFECTECEYTTTEYNYPPLYCRVTGSKKDSEIEIRLILSPGFYMIKGPTDFIDMHIYKESNDGSYYLFRNAGITFTKQN